MVKAPPKIGVGGGGGGGGSGSKAAAEGVEAGSNVGAGAGTSSSGRRVMKTQMSYGDALFNELEEGERRRMDGDIGDNGDTREGEGGAVTGTRASARTPGAAPGASPADGATSTNHRKTYSSTPPPLQRQSAIINTASTRVYPKERLRTIKLSSNHLDADELLTMAKENLR